jgi:DUF1680 family protein
LYCVEQADHGASVAGLHLDVTTSWQVVDGTADLGHHKALKARGTHVTTTDDQLYVDWRRDAGVPVNLTLIPYHLWANRTAGAMKVWLPLA